MKHIGAALVPLLACLGCKAPARGPSPQRAPAAPSDAPPATNAASARNTSRVPGFRLGGEYEPVERLLLAWSGDIEGTVSEMAALAAGRVPITIVTDPSIGTREVRTELRAMGVDTSGIDVFEASIESPWIRDFGPLVSFDGNGRREVIDLRHDFRPHADEIPARLAPNLWPGATLVELPFDVDGGNITSNGHGLCMTTSMTVEGLGLDAIAAIEAGFRTHLGCETLIFLPPLQGEPTGHVDMFAAFIGPRDVILGRYDQDIDSDNAWLLDQAEQSLEQYGLTVHRIPMPDNRDGRFRSYVNLLMLGDIVLVPVYPEETSHEAAALEELSHLLPHREILPVVASEAIELEGAIHCLAQTVPRASER